MGFVAMLAVNLLLSVLTPRPQVREPQPGTVKAPKIAEGTELTVVFGRAKVEPLYFWAGDGKAQAIKKKGGKK